MTNLALTPRVRSILKGIVGSNDLNAGVMAMRSRSESFASTDLADLVGAAVLPESRDHLEEKLAQGWDDDAQTLPRGASEVLIGGGFHAAVYSAVRVLMGFDAPLVLEQTNRPGGAFAFSQRPSFYLNSRNRPGGPGRPAEGGTLNYLPGSPIQPYDLSSDEFQRNSDVAFVVRLTLALAARVLTNRRVAGVEAATSGRTFRVVLSTGESVLADRVLDARGLGDPRMGTATETNLNIITFEQLMGRMGKQMFPLRGLRRVAVVGDGDSGKTAIEALTGQGPVSHWSVPSLDYVEQIDWYGRELPQTCEDWVSSQRTRYKRIGSLLPRAPSARGAVASPIAARVRPINGGGTVTPGFDCAYVNDRAYDLVILCMGFRRKKIEAFQGTSYIQQDGTSRRLARQVLGSELYRIGPAATIGFDKAEQGQGYATIEENKTAMFRLAGRTAALARMLSNPTRRVPEGVTVAIETKLPNPASIKLVDNENDVSIGDLQLQSGDRFTMSTPAAQVGATEYTFARYDENSGYAYCVGGAGWKPRRVPIQVSQRVLSRLRTDDTDEDKAEVKVPGPFVKTKNPLALVPNPGLTLLGLNLKVNDKVQLREGGKTLTVRGISREFDGDRYRPYVTMRSGESVRADAKPVKVSSRTLTRGLKKAKGQLDAAAKKAASNTELAVNRAGLSFAKLDLQPGEKFILGGVGNFYSGEVQTFLSSDRLYVRTSRCRWDKDRVPSQVSRSALERLARQNKPKRRRAV